MHEVRGAPGVAVPDGGEMVRQQILGVDVSTGPAGVAVAAGTAVFGGLVGFFVFVGVFVGTRVRVGVNVGVGVSVGVKVLVDVLVAVFVGVQGASPSKFKAVAVGTGSSMATFISSECSSASSGDIPRSRIASLRMVKLITPRKPPEVSWV